MKPQDEPFHVTHYLGLKSCLDTQSPKNVVFHYHYEPFGELWERIKGEITHNRVELIPMIEDFQYRTEDKANEPYRYCHHADILRLKILKDVGGCYFDIDTLFVNPVPESLFQKECVLGMDYYAITSNAVILSKPKSDFITEYAKRQAKVFNGSWLDHSSDLLTKMVSTNGYDVHVEHPRTFYPFAWDDWGLLGLF
jgi:hypothetical protein